MSNQPQNQAASATPTCALVSARQNPLQPGARASTPWTPRIVAFFCNWCTYTAADLAGVSRMKYASNIRTIRLMCSGRVDPQFILDAFSKGADGVLIGGCHPNDCHYAEGNYKCLRRFRLLKRMLADLGIEDDRLRLEWISAAEGDKVKSVVNDMVEKLTQLGPLGMPQRYGAWDSEMDHLEHAVQVKDAAQGPCENRQSETEAAHV